MAEIKSCIKNNLASLSFVSDIWSNGLCHNSYLDLTCLYIDENFKLRHQCIAFRHFPQSHTADNIFSEFETLGQEFGFDVLDSPFTTDSGANIKCALKNGIWQPCFDHTAAYTEMAAAYPIHVHGGVHRIRLL